MNIKLCGYTCEHNKGGVCQITYCVKQPYITTKTDEPLQEKIQIFTRYQDPTIEEYKKEIDRLNNIINALEKELKDIYVSEYSLTEKEINNKLKALKVGDKE